MLGAVPRSLPRRPARACTVVDAVGEWLASALGITTPRYQYIIDDLVMQQREVRCRAEQARCEA